MVADRKSKIQAAVVVGIAVALAVGYGFMRVPLKVKWLVARGAPPAEPETSRSAMAELRAMGVDARRPLLDLILTSNEEWPRKAWAASVALRSPFHLDQELRAALASPDPNTARAAVFALLDGHDVEAFEETRAEVHRNISGLQPPPVDMANRIDHAPMVPILTAWLDDTNDAHRGFAARLLGRIPPGDPRVPEALLRVVEGAPDLLVDGAGPENVAAKFVVVDALQSLLRYAPEHADVVARVCAVVRRMQGPAMLDSSWDIQRYAMDLLELSRGRGVDFQALELLASSDQRILRQKLAGLLGDLQGPVAGLLERLLQDEHPLVRRSALQSLTNRRDPATLRVARYVAEDSYIHLRAMAIRGVGDVFGVDADYARELLPFVLACLENPWPGTPVPTYGNQQDSGEVAVVEACLLSLTRVTGLHPGFRLVADMGDHKALEAAARDVLGKTPRGVEILEGWRRVVTAEPEERRLPVLLEHLTKDIDPENILRAMRELHRMTKESTGFPPVTLQQTGDDTDARNAIRLWMKDGREACVNTWKEILKR